jgi:hypothetical protein
MSTDIAMMERVIASLDGLVLSVLSSAARTTAWVRDGVMMEFAVVHQDLLVEIALAESVHTTAPDMDSACLITSANVIWASLVSIVLWKIALSGARTMVFVVTESASVTKASTAVPASS